MGHCRRLLNEAKHTVVAELGGALDCALCGAFGRVLQRVLQHRLGFGAERFARELDVAVHVIALERRALKHGAEPAPVGPQGVAGRAPNLAFAVFGLDAAHHDARHEAFHIPVPRGDRGLVEVVEIEDDLALGRRKEPEIADVGVAAGRNQDA